MRVRWKEPLALAAVLVGCTPNAPAPSAEASVAVAEARPAPLACAMKADAEMVHDAIISDLCLEDFFGVCRGSCIQTCTQCGEGCTTESCRTACLTARDHCARDHDGHCASEYLGCRTKLVSDWLARGCDSVCAPFKQCLETCGRLDGGVAGGECLSTCDAAGKAKGCVPVRCDAMQSATERKVLDPKWKTNKCDAVCAKIWSCAESECEKSSCVEPIKKYQGCALRTPGSAACALQDRASTLLCTEPPH